MGIGLVLRGATLKPQGDRHVKRIAAECALRHRSNSPASLEELTLGAAIALHIVIELGLPECRPCRWGGRIRAPFMAVPEAAVNEANGTVATENEIRRSGETPDVESESKPLRVKCPSKNEFGLGVLGRYARHHPRSSGLVDDVGHRVAVCVSKLPKATIAREVAGESKWPRTATVVESQLGDESLG